MSQARLRVVGNGVDDDFDPWALGAAPYSPDKVYTRSVDRKGHKEVMHVSMPPDLMARAGEIVASKTFPEYRTVHDIMRDALVHRLHTMAEKSKDGDLLRAVTIEMRNCEMEQMGREMEELDKHVKLAETLLDKARKQQDVGMLERLVAWAEGELEELREPYGSQMRKVTAEGRKLLVELEGKKK